jgi:hypothetical protein
LNVACSSGACSSDDVNVVSRAMDLPLTIYDETVRSVRIFFQDKEEKRKLQIIDHQAGHEVAMFAEFAQQLSHN